MKNKFIKIIFTIALCLNFFQFAYGEDFIFNVTEIEIEDNGNLYRGINKGKVTTDNQIEITSDNFKYLKKANSLEVNGNVELTDLKNNIIINAEKIFYLKDDEIIYTVGETKVKVSDEYIVNGYDLTLRRNKMILSSDKNATISDSKANIYKLSNFEYLINQEILKGKKIKIVTNFEKAESDEFFFEDGFFNLKENKFLAKDVNIKFHKDLFDDNKNDPRINSVISYGDQQNTYFEKGVFTSCKKTDKCPPWKIKSKKIHHDKVKKQINYENAWLSIYDTPVVYFPRFFHPDPTVKRQSGFLKPKLGSSGSLGDSIYIPYFHVVSEKKDITIKPRIFTDKFVLQSEYRQKTKSSSTITDFSFTKGHNSYLGDNNDSRMHFFTNTKMDLDLDKYINSTLEVNYEKTSNDNYLKLFNLKSPLLRNGIDVLESIISLDLEHQDYDLSASFQMYETLEGSNSDRYTYVLPAFNFSKNFIIKNLDGSFNFNSSGSNNLASTNIMTSNFTNDLNYVSDDNFLKNGIKTGYEISLRNINSLGKNHSTYKDSPQSELMSIYAFNTSLPLVKDSEKSLNTLEPKLSFKFSPHDMKNNSDRKRRIDANNIFNINRLSMDNSFETGESITAGLNFSKEKKIIEDGISEIVDYLDLRLATSFRFNEENNIPHNSSLNKKASNIFGQLNYKPIKNLSINYNFSLNNDLNTLNYNNIVSKIKFDNFYTQFNFLEENGVIGKTNIIENITRYSIDEENFLSFKTRKNRNINLTEYYNLLYEYKNDCLVASIQYKKNYYNDADIKPLEELFFTITIVPLTTFSPDKMALR